MEFETLRKLSQDDALSINKIANSVGKSPSTIRYWLKKFGLKTVRGPRGKAPKYLLKSHKCACGETDPDKFYGKKKYVCGMCVNKYNTEKGKIKKNRAREYLGGKCVRCGYSESLCALDMHHTKPELKDPNFKSMRYWSWDRIVKELSTCILLCRNCHSIEHNEI